MPNAPDNFRWQFLPPNRNVGGSERAQRANKLYRIRYLSLGSLAAEASRFDAFRAGLAALGYIEGKNLVEIQSG
jgi:hypothetical protein